MYNAAITPQIMIEPMTKLLPGSNMVRSISSPFGLCLLFGSANVITTITAQRIRNIMPIRSKNGISGAMNLPAVDNGIVSNAAVNAAAEVVRFQNIPRMKIAKTGRLSQSDVGGRPRFHKAGFRREATICSCLPFDIPPLEPQILT